jgi:SAM-dependent methyltransferase
MIVGGRPVVLGRTGPYRPPVVDDWFGPEVAASYDADEADMFAPEVLDAAVAFLARLAGDGAALELAIGTGRVALPLAAQGVEVAGIDLSPAMVEQLRRKPGGVKLAVELGDMAHHVLPSAGQFGLVYLVFNTITNVVSQDDQAAVFANAARHLAPGGHFVVECFVPQVRRLALGERFVAFDVGPGHIGIDEYDLVTQGLTSHHLRWRGGEYQRTATPFRFVWPAELDLMARLAGLTAVGRWAGWSGEPFTQESPSHVSVWAKASADA